MENKTPILKRKKLFENFLIIGINNSYLDFIEEESLLMTPYIINAYPNHANEFKQFDSYKNFCYHEGVKVIRNQISTEEEYSMCILESNVFSVPIETFCFIRPSNYDTKEKQKYLFGFKFQDIYIMKSKAKVKHNIINVFKYEKVYLIVSTEPSFQAFEAFCLKILEIKKLNLLNNIMQFYSIYEKEKYLTFTVNNNEFHNKEIEELIQYGCNNTLTKTLNHLSTLNREIDINETHQAWLLRKVMPCIDSSTFNKILTMVLCEQPIIFYGDNLELITFTTCVFAFIINPFVWKFPLIPNLPFDNIDIASSPVPFLLGILGNKEQIYTLTGGVNCHMVNVKSNGINITRLNNTLPSIGQLYGIIDLIFWELNGKDDYFKDNKKKMKEIAMNAANNLYEGINKLLCEKIKNIAINTIETKETLDLIQHKLLLSVGKYDTRFFNEFSETEMFMSYYHSVKQTE